MEKLPDKILLRIFSFIHFTGRIVLRTVSRRGSFLLYDDALLEDISITQSHCQDQQLSSLIAAAKRLIAVDFFNSHFLDGSCLLLGGLSGFRRLTLSGTSVTDRILASILRITCRDLEELHLIGMRISKLCLPEIITLRKLKYIGFPPEDVCRFGKSGVLSITKASPSLRILDCQEGYFFVQEEISQVVSNNCNLTSLIIRCAFVDDNTFLFIIESLQNLTHICVCETNVSQACVDRMKIRKPLLNISGS